VIHRVLVWVALACSLLVFASFALFARDQLAGASQHQQNELAAGQQTTSTRAIPIHHARQQPRRFIDGATARLEAPFKSFVSFKDAWVSHLLLVVLALLVYGIGIGWLARFANGLAHGVHRNPNDAVSTYQ